MRALWHIQLLGGLRLHSQTRTLTRFRTHQTGALLAYLAYHPHHSHPRELLLDILWPDATPEAGRNCLRVALSSLRRQLEPPGVASGMVLRADRFAVGLNPAAITTDVEALERALVEAQRAAAAGERAAHLQQALSLYQAPLLPGYYEERVVEARRVAEVFAGGVWFVGLADLSTARRIPDALVEALGLSRSPNVEPLERAARFLNGLGTEPSAPTPDAQRQHEEALGVRGEALGDNAPDGQREFPVPPLPVPAWSDGVGEGVVTLSGGGGER